MAIALRSALRATWSRKAPARASGRTRRRTRRARLNRILTEIAHSPHPANRLSSQGDPGTALAMFFIIGAAVVTISVIGGYAANGGHLGVLWQPFEFII